MFFNKITSILNSNVFNSDISIKIILIIFMLLIYIAFYLYFIKHEIRLWSNVIISIVFSCLFIILCSTTFKHNIENSTKIENIASNNSEEIKEYPQNIIDNYLKATESYQQLLEEGKIDISDLTSVQEQINELTNNVIIINNKIDKLNDNIENNYNSNIISSIITGSCTIIAALITAKSIIKVIVYKIQNENQNKHKKHKK